MVTRIAVILAMLVMVAGCTTMEGQKPVTGKPTSLSNTGQLSINCNVEGAQLRVDGAFWGTVPAGWQMSNAPGQLFTLSAGSHQIEVSSPGYEPYAETIEIARGNNHYLLVRLKPIPGDEARKEREAATVAYRPGQAGQFYISVDSTVSLYVDGRPYGELRPGRDIDLRAPAGEHKIVLKSQGYKDYLATVFLSEYNAPKLYVTMEPIAAGAKE